MTACTVRQKCLNTKDLQGKIVNHIEINCCSQHVTKVGVDTVSYTHLDVYKRQYYYIEHCAIT